MTLPLINQRAQNGACSCYGAQLSAACADWEWVKSEASWKGAGEKSLSRLRSRRGITLRIMLTVHFAGVRQLILCTRAGSQVKKDWTREFDQAGECFLPSKADIVCPPFLSHRCSLGLQLALRRRCCTLELKMQTAATVAASNCCDTLKVLMNGWMVFADNRGLPG